MSLGDSFIILTKTRKFRVLGKGNNTSTAIELAFNKLPHYNNKTNLRDITMICPLLECNLIKCILNKSQITHSFRTIFMRMTNYNRSKKTTADTNPSI